MSCFSHPYGTLRWASRSTPLDVQTLAGIGDALFQFKVMIHGTIIVKVGYIFEPAAAEPCGRLPVPGMSLSECINHQGEHDKLVPKH